MSTIKSYTRVIRTEAGGSAFEDATLDLGETPVAEGLPPMLVGALGPAHGVVPFLRFAAFPAEPHPANEPQWVVVIRGTLEVEVSDGSSRRFSTGDLVLATDTTGHGHITRVIGDEPVEALGIPTTVAD